MRARGSTYLYTHTHIHIYRHSVDILFFFLYVRNIIECADLARAFSGEISDHLRVKTDRTMAGAMRFSWIFTATVLLVLTIGVKCKRKFDGDFEFAEEVS